MRKILIVLVLLSFSTLSFAQSWFPVQAQIRVTQLNATAIVQNNFGYPVICYGQVQGYTNSGIVIYGTMNQIRLFPGQYAYINAYTNAYNPFVNAYSSVYCRY